MTKKKTAGQKEEGHYHWKLRRQATDFSTMGDYYSG